MNLLEFLDANTQEMGEFHLQYNPQRACYESVEKWLEDNECFSDPSQDHFEFETPEERKKAIAENTIVVLQWYPRSPVGFNTYAASTIEELSAYVKRSCGGR